MDDMFGGVKFFDDHPERDQCKCSEALDRDQETKQLSPEIIRVSTGQRHSQKKPHLWRVERAGISFHAENVISEDDMVKVEFSEGEIDPPQNKRDGPRTARLSVKRISIIALRRLRS
jgi:hypothetical protein